MVIGSVKIQIYGSWIHSLKEKRMLVKSICAKVRNKYNVSIAEVDTQDIHQSITLGFCCATTDSRSADSVMDHVLNFIDSNFDGEIVDIQREII